MTHRETCAQASVQDLRTNQRDMASANEADAAFLLCGLRPRNFGAASDRLLKEY